MRKKSLLRSLNGSSYERCIKKHVHKDPQRQSSNPERKGNTHPLFPANTRTHIRLQVPRANQPDRQNLCRHPENNMEDADEGKPVRRETQNRLPQNHQRRNHHHKDRSSVQRQSRKHRNTMPKVLPTELQTQTSKKKSQHRNL